MRSLRDIVFRWFLGGVLLLVTTFAAITVWTGQDLLAVIWSERAGPFVRYVAEMTVEAYEDGGTSALETLDQKTSLPAGVQTFLLSPDGTELRGRKIDPGLASLLASVHTGEDVKFKLTAVSTLAAIVVKTKQNRLFRVGLIIPDTPITELPLPLGAILLRVGLGLCIAAAACYWLANHLTRPLTRLREAARKFAGGDLRARGGTDHSLHKVAEIHALARDFDEMAARIESLMEGQRRLLLDVSHELRTPLTRMTLTLGIARRTASAEILPSLERMEREAEKLNLLITRVIAVNRMESNGVPLVKKTVDLMEIVSQVVEDARIEAQAQQKFVQLLNPMRCMLEGDPELLASAIENVVRNAIRHTATGTAVDVRLIVKDGSIELSVTDNGPGVPEDHLPRIFDPFYRVQKGREMQSGGIGLGLTIADRAVRLHGGKISPKNRPEGGLEMEISLPQLVQLT